MGFSLSSDLSARDSNTSPRSEIGRGLIGRVMTKHPCYDLFIIQILLKKRSTESSLSTFFEGGGNLIPRLTGNLRNTKRGGGGRGGTRG